MRGRIDPGDNGNPVYQIQADYQTYSAPQVNENSYLRLMEIDLATATIKVKTFSPYCETSGECPAYKTDADNEFELSSVKLQEARTAAHARAVSPGGKLRWWLP